MKSAAYIARMFKGYYILSHELQRNEDESIWHIFKLTRLSGNIVARYYVRILRSDARSAKERREQAQAKELVQALEALPRY